VRVHTGQPEVKQAIKQVESIVGEPSRDAEVVWLFETEEEAVRAAKRLLHAGWRRVETMTCQDAQKQNTSDEHLVYTYKLVLEEDRAFQRRADKAR